MSKIKTSTVLVIFGISGDLAKRKLLPAIGRIAEAGILPEHFKIIGISRRTSSLADLIPHSKKNFLRTSTEIIQMDVDDPKEYLKLKNRLEALVASFTQPTQFLFYFSVPPTASQGIIKLLGRSGINTLPNVKLLLEKPFGIDLRSAKKLIREIKIYFAENKVYRIDHYLAKEMVQNLVVFRAKNYLFKKTWNNKFIESIEIVAEEQVDIEGRVGFYEQTGALRDLVQSHLLQLVALTLMELPTGDNWEDVPQQRLKALQKLILSSDISNRVVRAQHEGYREQVGNVNSTTETFVSLTLYSKAPQWRNVPITITTGKALSQKMTEIRIRYKQDTAEQADTLTLRIQPGEGVEICLWVKQPGYERDLKQVKLNFSYIDYFNDIPEAYERVFIDAMRGDRSLFTTSDEVLASWKILAPIQADWIANNSRTTNDLRIYKKASSSNEIIKNIN